MILKLRHHFDSAHRLMDYDGKCNNIHGHTWKVIVNIKFNDDAEKYICDESDNNGILIDFKEIKKVINYYDHKLLLRYDDPIIKMLVTDVDVISLLKNPTAEFLSIHISKNIRVKLRELKKEKYIDSIIVTVFESSTAKSTHYNKR